MIIIAIIVFTYLQAENCSFGFQETKTDFGCCWGRRQRQRARTHLCFQVKIKAWRLACKFSKHRLTMIIIYWISNACINKNGSSLWITAIFESKSINNRKFDNAHLTNIFDMNMIIIWGLIEEKCSLCKKILGNTRFESWTLT